MEKVTQKKGEGENLIAILSYIGLLFLVPLLASKDNAFAKFHAKQGLTLFIAEIATFLIAWIPILGWIVGMTAWVVWIVLSIIGITNVVKGREAPLPIIGKFATKFKF
ncbi:DUF4870 domain-containing protein [Patescibacteria group bacterium]|nr:DUF4870 domain-containing protein [Patescibacteria group bacterium]